MSRMVQRFEQIWEEICKEVDRDGNEEISFAEFSRAMLMVLENKAVFLASKKR